MARVVLAMSGGVDSSVAAHLLIQQGHEVIGVFMRHGEKSPVACEITPENLTPQTSSEKNISAKKKLPKKNLSLPVIRKDHKQGCCTASDAEDARRIAEKLNIPFYSLNLQEEFSRIIDYFVEEYTNARTPNPCVQCNNWIKFGKLFDYADSVGAEFLATGHYAQLKTDASGMVSIHRGVDEGKDQSYVLFGIPPEKLSRMMLPVGSYQKPEIRRIAETMGMRVAEKKDSQEICFVTRGRYDEFVRSRRGPNKDTSGEMVTTDGTVVGTHNGIEGFTVGQRKGLGVALGDRRFVVRIEAETCRVIIGEREEMLNRHLTAKQVSWQDPTMKALGLGPQKCYAQIRYNAKPAPGKVTVLAAEEFTFEFDEPQFGIAPGQAVVCFDSEKGQRVLGGGWIESSS